MLNVKNARTLLPKVGDVRMEIPTTYKTGSCASMTPARQECTVVEVNREHLWYRVRFNDTGWYECYKVPRLKTSPQGGLL